MIQSTGPRRAPWHHRTLAALMRELGRIGIRINPFLVVREAETVTPGTMENEDLEFAIAGPGDIDELLRLQRGHNKDSIAQWFAEGKLCFTAKHEDRLVALMWCDLDAFNYPPNFRKLSQGEAYLFAAISDPEYRGRSVAPSLRLFCYDELRKRGVTSIYSYTDYYNSAARRFKAKLNARDLRLRVAVDLWGRWSWTFTLKHYD